METWIDTLFLSHNQKKDNNKFKNKNQPELPGNRTVWKSDNQGIKEETFTQTSRRGRDGQLGGEDSQQGGGWRTGQPHIPVKINWEERLGKRDRPCNPGFQRGEIKPQSL